MNNSIELLNTWGGHFIHFAWPIFWQSSALIVALFALDVLLRRRVRAVVVYALWMLLLVKLLLPTSMSLPTGLGYWVVTPSPPSIDSPSTKVVHPAADIGVPVAGREVSAISPTDDLPTIASVRSTAPMIFVPKGIALQLSGYIMVGWVLGVVVLTVAMFIRLRMTRRLVRRALPADLAIRTMVNECRRQMGVRQMVELRITESVPVPVVCGLIRPVILLPGQLISGLATDQLWAVFLHELAHVRRGDLWVSHLQTVLQVIHFYNPLLWLANAAIRRVREQAADETVLVTLADDAVEYPETLLNVAKLIPPEPRLAFGLVGIFETKSKLAQRIRLMLGRPFPRTSRLGLGAVFIVLILGAVLLPMTRAPEKEVQSGSADSTTPEPVYQGAPASFWLAHIDNGIAKNSERASDAFEKMGSNAIPFLREKLSRFRTPSPDTRRQAAMALQQLSPVAESALPDLISALDDKVEITCFVVAALGAFGPKAVSAVPALFNSLRSGNGRAAHALVKIAPDDPSLIPALIECFTNANLKSSLNGQTQEGEAAVALKRLGPKAKEAVPVLRQALTDPKLGPWAAIALRIIAPDDKEISAIATSNWVARSDTGKSIEELVDAAGKNTEPMARVMAMQDLHKALAIAEHRGSPAPAQLVHDRILLLFNECLVSKAPLVVGSAAQSLPVLGVSAKLFIPKLLRLLEKDDRDVRSSVLNALAKISPGDPQTLPIVIRLLNEPGVCYSAVRNLAEFGPDAMDAVPALRLALNNRDQNTRFMATLALWRIGKEPPSISILRGGLEIDGQNGIYIPLGILEILGGQERQTVESLALLHELERHWSPEVRSKSQALLKQLGENLSPAR